MRYKYYFCEWYNENLMGFLKENNACYSPDKGVLEGELISFSVWSDWVNVNMILSELKKMKMGYPVISVEFSQTELNDAKWLVMSPKRQCVDIINAEEAYNYTCCWTTSNGISKANHEEQKGLFAIRKEPSMKTQTAFWTEDTGFAEIFTDYRVVKLVKDYSLGGVEFKSVMDKKGIRSENIFQMKSSNIIEKDSIATGYGEQKEVCPICGKEQFVIDNTYQLHLDFSKIDSRCDLYMTERIFGEGIAYPLYIISQRFYQLLKQNKLAGGIGVSPVVDIC